MGRALLTDLRALILPLTSKFTSARHPKNLPPTTAIFIMQRPRAAGSVPSNAYVLSIAALPDCYAAAASSPADTIHLYAKADLRHLTALEGHPGGTTSMQSVNFHAASNASSPTLTSCGKDGCIRIWDLRSNSPSLESAFPKHAFTRRFPLFCSFLHFFFRIFSCSPFRR